MQLSTNSMSQQLFNVKLKSKGKNYECSKVDSILESGLRSGLALRYECNNGTCGSCKARLLTGNIKQIKHYDFSLSKAELANAEFLMCCHAPTTDIEIELDLIGDVRSIPLQKIETKVREISFISDNMALMRLRAPRSKALQFMAGQDVELAFNSNRARYPLASCPCQMLDLEFHIRNNPADDFAQALFSKALKVKSKVILQGPKGIF
ncbi:MAG: 2Fe-2S iron-sulfur cluster binding domain-containing protein, partial [Candidatus Thioglobus sp.]|nr:2Fe-2S iron-sulfur cluster binding domain-containing protein [Candidatus Thioglobus sp.]